MARVALGAAQPLRLDHHQTQRAVEVRGFGQRGVVAHAQVALEPDQRRVTGHVAEPGAARHQVKDWPLSATTTQPLMRQPAPACRSST